MSKYDIESSDFFNLGDIPKTEEMLEEKTQDNTIYKYDIESTFKDRPLMYSKPPLARQSFQSIDEFRNDKDVLQDWDIVANALGEKGEDVVETLRDSDFSLYTAMKRAGQTGKFSQGEIDAFNRLRTKFANTKLKGFYEYADLIGDFTVDTVADPFTLLAILATPFTGGGSLAAKQAATLAVLNGTKRYAFSKALIGAGGKTAQQGALKSLQAKALRPAAFSTAEGAVWTGAHDYYNQDIDINLGNQENIDWGRVAKSGGFGAAGGLLLGGGIGLYSGAKYYNRLRKYHDEEQILKQVDEFSKEAIKDADNLAGVNKDYYKDRGTLAQRTKEEWLDEAIAAIPMVGKATSQFLSIAKKSNAVKDFLLKFRYDSTRTIFGKNQADDSLGALSFFENLQNYNGEYTGVGINRIFNHMGYGRGNKLTPKDNNALHQLMLDDTKKTFLHTDGVEYDIPKEVMEAYFGKKDIGLVGMKDLLDNIFEEGVKLGEFSRTQKVTNYFPRVFNHGVLKQRRDEFKDLLIEYGYANPNNEINPKKYLTKYITATGKEEVGIPADTVGLDMEVFGIDFIFQAEQILGKNASAKNIIKKAQDLKANKIIDGMLDLKYSNFTSGVGPRAGGKTFQQHRIFNNIPDERLGSILDGDSSFVSNNVMEVLGDYMANVAQLYARKKTFGVRNLTEFQNTIKEDILKDLKILGATDDQAMSTANRMENLFMEVTGIGEARGLTPTTTAGIVGNRASETIRLTQQAAHLAFAVPSSITEPLLPFQRIGIRDYPRAVFNLAEGLWKEIKKDTNIIFQKSKANLGLGKAKFKDLDDEYWKELYAGGLAIENNILEGLDRIGSGERFYSKNLRNASDAFFKMTFLTQWTRAVQGGAFTSGKMLIRRNLQKLYDHKMGIAKLTEGNFRNLGMNKKSYLEKQLKELGIDPEEGMAWYRSSLDDNLDFNPVKAQRSPFYREKYLEGAKRFTNEVILNPNRAAASKSLVMQSGWGKILFQFMSYPTLFNNIVIKRMLNELREYPVQTAPKLLATGFLMTSIAMQMNLFRNPERHSKMSAEENLVEAVERWGGLAQVSIGKRTADAAKYGSGYLSLARGIFGPTVGDAFDSIEYKLGPSVFAVRNMPFGQIYKRTNPENFKELQERANEFDKFLLEEIGLDRQGRISTGDTDRSAYRTGSLVTNVPNASKEPEKRINKMTGMPYDIEAGPNAQPEKTRVGLSEEGKFLGALQRRKNAYHGGRQTMNSGGQSQSYKDILFNFIAQAEDAKLYQSMLKGENPELTAYLPTPNDVQTIGFGRTRGVTKDTKSTLEEEKHKLREELELFESETIKSIGRKQFDSLNNNQKAAVISLIFNVGRSAFDGTKAQTALKSGDYDTFVKEAFDPQLGFTKQRNADGQLEILEGLQNRRQAEKDLFLL